MDKRLLRKYRRYAPVSLPERTWPDRVIEAPPVWCSVDLRDGNQALERPMDMHRKLEMYHLLLDIGFKEIEVGFPAASRTEFEFLRHIIERGLIPEGVWIQVLTQARPEIIRRTFEALRGAPRAIVHLYNSTSTLQRQVVFRMSRSEITALAVEGARLIRELAADFGGAVRYEYSPESFTGTELDFAVDICEAVMEVWEPATDDPVIINLPATVEMATPNVYADQIEWFCGHMKQRDRALISLHAHNDRGSAVAATELALMAGGDRVEGTLFGNGERTGNVDLVTVALNMYTQGVDPGLDLHDMQRIVNVYEHCTRMRVPPRQPYAGDLVFTAFSGSHQDAINKGMRAAREHPEGLWQVPYLPIDPRDLGRSYESVVRLNSQSGKGGLAHVMSREYGYELPKGMQAEFMGLVQQVADETGEELLPAQVMDLFRSEYLERQGGISLVDFNVVQRRLEGSESRAEIEARIRREGGEVPLRGAGTGPLDAFCAALHHLPDLDFEIGDYQEHALGSGADARAVAYVMVVDSRGGETWGVGQDTDITIASIRALLCALNRAMARD